MSKGKIVLEILSIFIIVLVIGYILFTAKEMGIWKVR